MFGSKDSILLLLSMVETLHNPTYTMLPWFLGFSHVRSCRICIINRLTLSLGIEIHLQPNIFKNLGFKAMFIPHLFCTQMPRVGVWDAEDHQLSFDEALESQRRSAEEARMPRESPTEGASITTLKYSST